LDRAGWRVDHCDRLIAAEFARSAYRVLTKGRLGLVGCGSMSRKHLISLVTGARGEQSGILIEQQQRRGAVLIRRQIF
jgi:hypothetical protein